MYFWVSMCQEVYENTTHSRLFFRPIYVPHIWAWQTSSYYEYMSLWLPSLYTKVCNSNLSEQQSKASYNASIPVNSLYYKVKVLTKSLHLLFFSTCTNTINECHITWVQSNHIVFIQCFSPSFCCWHAHVDVQRDPVLRQSQQWIWHCFRQVHDIISKQLSGNEFEDIKIGCRSESFSIPFIQVKKARVWHNKHFSKSWFDTALASGENRSWCRDIIMNRIITDTCNENLH